MNQDDIHNTLIKKGFDEETSGTLAENLVNLSPELRPLLNNWLVSGAETDFGSNGVSIKQLMSEYDMQYQAALLTMDWILKEPIVAMEALKKGIR